MSLFNTYISVSDYLRAPSGQDTSTLVGNVATLSSSVALGATSLPISPAATVAQSVGDRITIFDGSNSEVVTVTGATSIGATSIPVTATAAAHATGTSLCSDGPGGIQDSLADMIVNASSQIEGFCRQSLLQATHSSERLSLRTMRASMSRDYTLHVRPKQFPVQSVSGVVLRLNATTTLTLDATQAMITADQQSFELAQISTTSGTVPFWGNAISPLRQTTPGWVEISYTAGYAYAQLPPEIRQAAIWLVSDLLSDRRNPTGAAELKLGKLQLVTRLRGDNSGRSVLMLRAAEILTRFQQKAM